MLPVRKALLVVSYSPGFAREKITNGAKRAELQRVREVGGGI